VAKCGLYGSIETDGDGSCRLPSLELLEPMAVLEDQAYKLQLERAGEHSILSEGAEGNDATGQEEEEEDRLVAEGHGTTGGSLGVVHEREEEGSFNMDSNSMMESEGEEENEADDDLEEELETD